MRTLLKFCLMGGVTLQLAGFAQAQDSCDKMQVYLQVAPNHAEDVMAFVAPRLKERTGADLSVETLGVTESLSRLNAQLPNPRITVAHLDGGTAHLACEQGLCNPIDAARIKNSGNLNDWAIFRNDAGEVIKMTHSVANIGFLVNTENLEKMNLSAPESWADLVDSDVVPVLGITAPQSTYGTAGLVQLSKTFGGSESSVEAGLEATKKMIAKGATTYTWSSEMSNLMQLGSISVAITGSSVTPSLKAKGIPVDFIWPKDGAPAVENTLVLVKDAPCQDEALEYLDIYFSDEFLAMRMKSGGGLAPSDAAIEMIDSEQAEALYLRPDDVSRLVQVDWGTIFKHRDQWIEQWKREVE